MHEIVLKQLIVEPNSAKEVNGLLLQAYSFFDKKGTKQYAIKISLSDLPWNYLDNNDMVNRTIFLEIDRIKSYMGVIC